LKLLDANFTIFNEILHSKNISQEYITRLSQETNRLHFEETA